MSEQKAPGCDHTYPPASSDGLCPSCGGKREQKTLAEVLADHRFTIQRPDAWNREPGCSCGWRQAEDNHNAERHAQHLQVVVLAHLASEQVVEAVAAHYYREEFGGCYCDEPSLKYEYDDKKHARHLIAKVREVLGGEGDE